MPESRGDTLVLCYHGVSEDWPSALAVTPEALERQLGFLVDRGYRGVTFREAVRGVEGKALAIDTRVPTPVGWQGARDHVRRWLQIGHRAREADPRPVRSPGHGLRSDPVRRS